MPRALLVNPWIHDFAAYDLWVRPLGLLRVGALLRQRGVEVVFIDLLNPYHPSVQGKKLKRSSWGHGALPRKEIPKPKALEWFPRRFKRYGIPPELAEVDLMNKPRPDAILVTSGMTYWYTGLQETIAFLKRLFPDVPVILGGIYATLLPEHARANSGADLVISGSDPGDILKGLSAVLPVGRDCLSGLPHPLWDLVPFSGAICVKASEGCPFRCPYCASHLLSPSHRLRSVEETIEEILYGVSQTNAQDIAFYDDALLWDAQGHLFRILDGLSGRSLRFHCPNGLHARYIDAEVARELKARGFKTIRLGLESSRPEFHSRMGAKLELDEFRQAVNVLIQGGYNPREIGAYILVGLPGQGLTEVEETVEFVLSLGLRPHLAEYSPIPGTALWDEAVSSSPFPISEEPLFQNNTLVPCRWEGLSYEDLQDLKGRLNRILQEAR